MTSFVDAHAIAARLRLQTTDDDCRDIAAAVNGLLDKYEHLVDSQGTPTPAARLGAVMLGARLHRRRNSPGGIEAIGEGSVFVARWDPDIAQLLGFDQHAAPGIA